MTATTPTLLLDLDGTISDNYPGISRSIAHALARLDAPPADAATLRTCVGPPLRETFRRLLATDDADRVERAIDFYRERFADVGWQENVPYDGIAPLLADLGARHRLYLCTAKPQVFARRIVDHFGFTPHFAAVYGAELDGRFDDKATLLAHIARTEAFDATCAVMIGDRAHDVRAARRNGARAVGVLWGYGSREELADADALAEAPADLPAVLARLPLPVR